MEARYYGLEDLEDRMSTVPSISALIVKENHRMQFPEYLEVRVYGWMHWDRQFEYRSVSYIVNIYRLGLYFRSV